MVTLLITLRTLKLNCASNPNLVEIDPYVFETRQALSSEVSNQAGLTTTWNNNATETYDPSKTSDDQELLLPKLLFSSPNIPKNHEEPRHHTPNKLQPTSPWTQNNT